MAFMLAAEFVLPVAEVTEKSDHRVRTYPGRVVPIQEVAVVPQVSGEILEVKFENGATVREGQVLYRIDSVKYAAAVKNAEAKLAETKASVKYAEQSYDRHRKLMESRAVSQDAVDNALSQRDSSRAAFAAAQAELTAAKDDLAHCLIVAPIAGKLGSTAKTKGNYVNKGSETLVTIVQRNPIRVRFSMSNRELLELFRDRWKTSREATDVVLTLADGTTYAEHGRPEYMDNTADETTDTMMIYARFDNPKGLLRTGGTVSVTVSTKEGVMRPAIPATAVLQDVRGPYVWIVKENGAVERRYIARGDMDPDDGLMFVEKGVKVGERLVADGGHKLRPDSTVKPASEAK